MKPLRELSLRTKLPFFLVGLTAAALLVAGALAYGEVRTASRAAAEARLGAAARQLADLSAGGVRARSGLEQEVGRLSPVRDALRGITDSVGVSTALRRLATPADGSLPIDLYGPDGSLRFRAGVAPAGADPDPRPPLEDARTYGPFRAVGDRVLYWTSTPLEQGGRVLGWIAQRRRLGNPETADQLEALIGSDVSITIGDAVRNDWVDLAGTMTGPPPEGFPRERGFVFDRGGDSPALAWVAPLEGSPWLLLLEMPAGVVGARPRVFLSRMLGAGILLLLLVGLVGWIGGLRLTGPLEALVGAADAVAAGDYGRRVRTEGRDEMARLGRAFNTMAEQVSRSDEALRHRLDEARALARRLEEANVGAERAREEAQAANRTKSEFLATMSHEIRTPINAVIGYTELLRVGIPDPPTEGQREYLDRVERSSRLLISLIDDVLDFSRIESGRLRVERGAGSVRQAILAARSALDPVAEQKGVDLGSECDESATFEGDALRVQQILLNLLSNAVKFTPQGGRVTVSCSTGLAGPGDDGDGQWLRIDVEDSGPGIPADQMERIFQPFVQGETGFTRAHGGTGLGLAISRRLASLMGGEITVASTRGRGSRFTVWLRMAVPSGSAART